MSERLSIEETCCCGATFKVNGGEVYTKHAAIAWRSDHRHEPQVAVQGSNRGSDDQNHTGEISGPQIGVQRIGEVA